MSNVSGTHHHTHDFDQIAGRDVGRLVALSDGVFAIALTLLVLEIRLPAIVGVPTDAAVGSAILSLGPRFLSYLLSFMTLGLFWNGHATQYAFINRSDRHLTWINLFLLMFVALLPFSAALLGEHMALRIAVWVFCLNVIAMTVFLLAEWDYAVRHDMLSVQGEERHIAIVAVRRRLRSVFVVYSLGAIVCIANTYLSVILIVLAQLYRAFAPKSWSIFRRDLNQ